MDDGEVLERRFRNRSRPRRVTLGTEDLGLDVVTTSTLDAAVVLAEELRLLVEEEKRLRFRKKRERAEVATGADAVVDSLHKAGREQEERGREKERKRNVYNWLRGGFG